MSRLPRRLALGAVVLGTGFAAGAGTLAAVDRGSSTTTVVRAAAAPATASNAAATAAGALSVNQIYRRDRAGVVEITATTAGGATQQTFPFGGGGGSGSSSAQGSGFVLDTDGHIVTNQHVVDGATSLTVRFADGFQTKATVVGSDASTDIAVIKVEVASSKLDPLVLGDSSALQVGDGVVAIGSPFGLEETVTTGIVSALDRAITSPSRYSISGVIQTDAAINHGNSGGPLLNLQGEVVGVNAQIESDSGGNDGVGFAIPSATVRGVAAQLIASGKAEHAYLGVSIGDGSGGATIGSIRSGTPAAKAGLKVGDIVTAFDGHAVTSAAGLESAISAASPGKQVTLNVRRSGKDTTVQVTLGTRPTGA